MKLKTNYTTNQSATEILDDNRITDGSQYMSINEIIRRSAAGEVIDLKDYSEDVPIDRMEKFDIFDNAESIMKSAKEFEKSLQSDEDKQPDQKVEEKSQASESEA